MWSVYSTPCVLRDVEVACRKLADLHLDPGEGNVGTRVNLEHLGSGLIGAEVTVHVRLVAVEGRRLKFEAQTHCGDELIAHCTHERFVVDLAKSKERLVKKRAGLLAKGLIRSGA